MSREWSTTAKIFVGAIAFFVSVYFLFQIRPLITPLIIAGLLAYSLNLVVRFLARRTRLSRSAAMHLVYFLFIALLFAAPGTLIPLAVRQAERISEETEDIIGQIDEFVTEPVAILGREFPIQQYWSDITAFSNDFETTLNGALSVVETTSINVLRLVIIIVVAYYLLRDWSALHRWMLRQLPEGQRNDFTRLVQEIDQVWRSYMLGTLALMIIVSIVFIIIGLAIGIKGAVAIGFMTGFFNIIPELGPWISGIIAVIVAYLGGSNHLPLSNFWFAVLVAAIFVVMTQVKSIWLRPQVLGRFMRINTGIVFLVIIGAAILQGILAALVILPIFVSVGIVARYVHARMLNLDPWPEDADVALAADTAETTGTPNLS